MDEFFPSMVERTEDRTFLLATIAEVAAGGLRLKIDGQDEAGEKLYPCNTSIRFHNGDRVKITPDSGTYIVDFVVGLPGADYAVPPGGTDGQVLAKAGADDYTLKWSDPPKAGENYIPRGGTTGQLLAKKSAYDYQLQWVDAPGNPLPTGGTDGQVLTKSGSTNFVVKWATPSITSSKLVNGSYSVALSTVGLLAPANTGSVNLGSNSKAFGDLYCNGTIRLAQGYSNSIQLGGSSATLGFFGKTPTSRKTVSNTATVATLITALKDYGLIV